MEFLVIVRLKTTSMDEDKIAERKQVLTRIIRHTYPINSKMYFFSNGSKSEILIIVDDEIVFHHTADLNDDSSFPSLMTHIITQPTSLGVEIADIPNIIFDGEDIPDIKQLLGQLQNG